MFFQAIKTPGIAHNAYLIGVDGIGIVIDPRRDVQEYLKLAQDHDLTIGYVVETHRQEDFMLGSAELRRITGAKVVAFDHELFAHADTRLADGQEIEIGSMRFRALHTPGHTPESVSWAAFVKESPDLAWAVFTGDALFIGETGRTDLPDPDRTGENAGLLFDAIHQKVAALGDQTLLYPAHGSGSVCGAKIADRDQSTLGLERKTNPVFQLDRKSFIQHKLHERLPRPPYFLTMEKANLEGGLPLKLDPSAIRLLQPRDFEKASKGGIVIDARLPEAFAGGHLPGSFSIWLDGLPIFGGWVADALSPVYLVVDGPQDLKAAVLHLERIGVDTIAGQLAGGFEAWRDAGCPIEESGTITPTDLSKHLDEHHVLDVRDITEFEDDGHIHGAQHIYVGGLERHVDEVRARTNGHTVAVICNVGHRASLAVSILQRAGFKKVTNVLGGMKAWRKLKLPTEKGAVEA